METPWICVRVLTRRERWAQDNIERLGFETYTPRFKELLSNKIECLFPGYIFARTRGLFYFLRGTWGVIGPLMSGESPTPVPNQLVQGYRDKHDRHGLLAPIKRYPFELGQRVLITHGPMENLMGIYDGMDARQRVNVLLDFLGGHARLVVERRHVMAA